MTFYLAGLNAIVLFLIIFGMGAILSIIGLLLFHKYVHPKKENWFGMRYTTSFFTIIGALLGVLLTMVIVTMWQNYQKEKENVIAEVANVVNFYRDAGALDQEDCMELRKQMRVVVGDIINDSWPKMRMGMDGTKVVISFNKLTLYLMNIKSKNLNDQIVKNALLKDLRIASDLRKNRILKVAKSPIPGVMWVVITICSIISISCGFFFSIKPFWMHLSLTMMHATMISAVIFLIISMMYPYRGATHITAEPFEYLLSSTFPSIDKEYELFNKHSIIIPEGK